jgi:tetratricopeptide (TPR) repeat protein
VKQQIILAGSGLLLISALFFWGPTVAEKSNIAANTEKPAANYNVERTIALAKASLSPARQNYLSLLENNVTRGDVATQQLNAARQLAAFWKDSLKLLEPYLFYLSKAAKLENSEKSLTFAAQFTLDAVRSEPADSIRNWKSAQAIELFEKAIQLNPGNDSLKVGLGSCYIFGKAIAGTNGADAMKGVGILREVITKDSTNMQAQLVLAVGGYVSGQYDKAIPRLLKVVKAEPNNLEALTFLADSYAASGQNAEAIKWYTAAKRMFNDPRYIKEVDERIKQLKQQLR